MFRINPKEHFKSGKLRGDIIAGIVTGSVVVPQSMSYALLANLPPEVGLYSCISMVVYAFLGTSPQLSVAPVAMQSLLVGAVTIFATSVEEAIAQAAIIAFFAGIVQFSLGLIRVGSVLAQWLSRTMLAGYTTGVSLTILISQLPPAFGVTTERTAFPIYNLILFFAALPTTKWAAFVFFFISFVTLLTFQKVIKPRLPEKRRYLADFGTIVVVTIGAASAYGLVTTYPDFDLPLVGSIPSGYKVPAVPPLANVTGELVGTSVAVGLVGFLEGYAVATNLPIVEGVSANRELIAVGASNLVSSFFNGYSVSGGLSRTMVMVRSGGSSQIGSIFAYLVVVLAILTLSGAMAYIPKSLLAAVIFAAVLGMIKYEQIKESFFISKVEFFVSVSTVTMVLAVGPMYALVYGLLVSIVMALYQIAVPHKAELGEMTRGEKVVLRNLSRYPDEAKRINRIVVVRVDAPLFFANAQSFFRHCRDLLDQRQEEATFAFVIDASPVSFIDISGLHELAKFQKALTQKGIRLVLAEVRGPVRDAITRFNAATKNKVTPFYERLPQDAEEGVGLMMDSSPAASSQASGPGKPATTEPVVGSQDDLSYFSVHTLEEAIEEIRKQQARNSPALAPQQVRQMSEEEKTEAGLTQLEQV